MTHEDAKAWLTARNVFPRVTPVPEPGMWHLQTEAEGYMEFVHRRTGEVLVFGTPTPDIKMYKSARLPLRLLRSRPCRDSGRPLGKRRAEQNRRRTFSARCSRQ